MGKKKIVGLISGFIIILIAFSYSAYAITGKIGNARMVINVEVGDTIEKSIRVINDNEVHIEVNLFASGDLINNIEIIDSNFTLQPYEEKNARFKIRITSPGKTNSKINVQFKPSNSNESGIGLSSNIIVNAYEKEGLSERGLSDDLEDVENEEDVGDVENEEIEVKESPIEKLVFKNKINTAYIILGMPSVILFIILLVLIYFSTKIKKRRRGDEKRIKKEVEKK
ncbi:MAG: hypothetical protein QW727_02350 [Candidatus Pacearchaeota archaeon]